MYREILCGRSMTSLRIFVCSPSIFRSYQFGVRGLLGSKSNGNSERSTVSIVFYTARGGNFLGRRFCWQHPIFDSASLRGKAFGFRKTGGFQEWKRKVTFSGGNVILSAELIVVPSTSKAPEGTPDLQRTLLRVTAEQGAYRVGDVNSGTSHHQESAGGRRHNY